MDNLSKPELLTLLSIMEGELEARDLVIEALRAQRKEVFLQERYGHYSLTDPFLALQRDFECGVPGGDAERRPLGSSPISVLEAVMAHCRKMQERMSAQLAAAESRQKRTGILLSTVSAPLENGLSAPLDLTPRGSRRAWRHQSDARDDFFLSACTCILHVDQHQLVVIIPLMMVWEAEADSEEEEEEGGGVVGELATRGGGGVAALRRAPGLPDPGEPRTSAGLQDELSTEPQRSQQMEAKMEKQLSEFYTEREQLRARLGRERLSRVCGSRWSSSGLNGRREGCCCRHPAAAGAEPVAAATPA
ncbi:cortactin-binding protein 2 [Lates japonicus]|uniref:Cortactin-binding protein 2 n=1 Tax=Lates japonicus TaxID=270547 RepID=A0AAD3NBZ0_LATJO|nr:cortactin-binding protein 2 [Lates japonicus]